MTRLHEFYGSDGNPRTPSGALDLDLANDGTTLTSSQLASLPDVASPDVLALTLVHGSQAKEIIWITDHTAGDTTATISRGKESTSADDWVIGTSWLHVPTDADLAAGPVAAFVDPSTATAAQVAQALIDAGLMAAS